MSKKNIEKIIGDAMTEIKMVDDLLIMEVSGVAQALDELRKSLDKVDACLDTRVFDKASSLGYSEVSSAFVFLQRTLGGLQSAQLKKEELISEVAMKSDSNSYEYVEPFVNKKMVSAQVRKK